MQFENGMHAISNEQYHNSKGISRSMLSEIKKSPFHYYYKYIDESYVKDEPTPAMNIGSAVHCLALEPHKWNHDFFICTQKTRPRAGTPALARLIEQANGRIILSIKETELAFLLANKIKEDSYCQLLLRNCEIEQSIYFTHEQTGLQCKVRPDAFHGTIAFDLKTTADASTRGFQASAYKFDYYLQAAMNFKAFESIGILLNEFIFIAIEKEPPYAISIDRVIRDDFYACSTLDFGLEQFDSRMALLKQCLDSGEWPGYGVRELMVPGWAQKELNYE